MSDCRLYLVSPPGLASGQQDFASFLAQLQKAVTGGDVAAFLLRDEGASEEVLAEMLDSVRPLTQGRDIALLIENRADVAGRSGCDGVQLPANPMAIRSVKKALGEDVIVGADCGSSRHLAMVAGEAGADYVCFDADAHETIGWWAELMEPPLVAWGGITLESAPAIVEAGADFIMVGQAIWTAAPGRKGGPKGAVAAFTRLLRETESEVA